MINSKYSKRNPKAKRGAPPAYSQALCQIKGVVMRLRLFQLQNGKGRNGPEIVNCCVIRNALKQLHFFYYYDHYHFLSLLLLLLQFSLSLLLLFKFFVSKLHPRIAVTPVSHNKSVTRFELVRCVAYDCHYDSNRGSL